MVYGLFISATINLYIRIGHIPDITRHKSQHHENGQNADRNEEEHQRRRRQRRQDQRQKQQRRREAEEEKERFYAETAELAEEHPFPITSLSRDDSFLCGRRHIPELEAVLPMIMAVFEVINVIPGSYCGGLLLGCSNHSSIDQSDRSQSPGKYQILKIE
ncbi:unnamed protein product [Cuscuta epithymum]|uniref:Uncharacterized protein n=1 Tax=Cuscuta epithymum TaxID=186058 RepID=A0AAV0EZ60_9ASTE|nr:unnamed protein product [Cuscuta epithymum]CAH9128525.1 unnamed protein product [Cuscuta epithymum]